MCSRLRPGRGKTKIATATAMVGAPAPGPRALRGAPSYMVAPVRLEETWDSRGFLRFFVEVLCDSLRFSRILLF